MIDCHRSNNENENHLSNGNHMCTLYTFTRYFHDFVRLVTILLCIRPETIVAVAFNHKMQASANKRDGVNQCWDTV